MTVSAQQVKMLREKTGAGMMECKKALSETDGDMEAAITFLRKQGLKASAEKASRIAAEGTIFSFLSDDGSVGALVEVNCETDFVAKNESFREFGNHIARLVGDKNPSTIEGVFELSIHAPSTVSESLHLLISQIGEKISLRRFARIQSAPQEKIGLYVHMGSKIGVMVHLGGAPVEDRIARDVAMHVAAAHPLYLDPADIPEGVVHREQEIYREQMIDSGKSQGVIDKVVEGKLAKYASEVCLNDQIFIKDPTGKKKIRQVLREISPHLKVITFVRYQVGEGMEKRKDDFGSEVAQMVR